MPSHHPEALKVFDAMVPGEGGRRLPAAAVPKLRARWSALPEPELRDALASLVGLAAWLDETHGQRAGAEDLMRFGDRLARRRLAASLREAALVDPGALARFGAPLPRRAPKLEEAPPPGTFTVGALNVPMPRPRGVGPAKAPEATGPRTSARVRRPATIRR